MKEILLTQNKVAIVDDDDYEWLNKVKWRARPEPHPYTTYAICNTMRTTERMHRVILGLRPGDKRQCDHVDGNGLNNQRRNLRVCSQQENLRSRRKGNRCKSKYKGVGRSRCWWRARIAVNGHRIHLGVFLLESDAASAYDAAALKYFGEFAKTNFPQIEAQK